MRTPLFWLVSILLLWSGRGVLAQEDQLEVALKAWEAASARLTGRIVVDSRLRQAIGMERSTEGAMLKVRPSMAPRGRPPTRIRYSRLKRQVDLKSRIQYQLDDKTMRIDVFPTSPVAGSSKRFSAQWNGGWWGEASGGETIAPAEFGEFVMRQPFGLPYPSAYRDAPPGRRFIDLIRQRPSRIEKEGEFLKILAPAGPDESSEAANLTFWLAPSKGMLPARWESKVSNGPVQIRVESRLDEVSPGLWAPTKIVARMFVADSSSPLNEKVVCESSQEVDRKKSQFGGVPDSIAADLEAVTQPRVNAYSRIIVYASGGALILVIGIVTGIIRRSIHGRKAPSPTQS